MCCSIAVVASRTREKETTDYATDQLGEWSSQSSEGDTDTEEEQGDEEEGEEEAGAMEEPSPMRLRSHSAHAKVWRNVTLSVRMVMPEPLVTVHFTHQEQLQAPLHERELLIDWIDVVSVPGLPHCAHAMHVAERRAGTLDVNAALL